MKNSTFMSFILMTLLGAGVALAQEEPNEGAATEEAGEEVVLDSEEPVSELPVAEEAVEEVPESEGSTASVAAEEVPSGAIAALMGVLKWVLGATGLTLIAQFIMRKNVRQKIPGWARPLIGPALGVLAVTLTKLVGFEIDFSIIEAALLGVTSAFVFDIGKEAGVLAGSSG